MGILPGEAQLKQNWKKLASKQGQDIRAIYAAEYTRERMEETKPNIYQVLTFIFKI